MHRIRKFEKKQDDRHHSHDLLEMSKLYRGLQIELLRDYAAQSKEMNMLYFQFHLKAKILFAAKESSKRSRPFGNQQQMTDSMFNLTEALTVMSKDCNWRGAGSCLMTLACMFASLCFDVSDASNRNLVQAIKFVIKAEDI